MTSGLRTVLLLPFLALVLISFLLFGFLSMRLLESRLLPEVERQAVTAALGVQRRVDHAISVFGGLHALRDVEPVLDSARSSAPGILFFALTGPDGDIRDFSGADPEMVRDALAAVTEQVSPGLADRLSVLWQKITGEPLFDPIAITGRRTGDMLISGLPLGGDQQRPAGFLYAGVDVGMLDTLKRDIWFDTATVVLATALIAVELLILIFAVFMLRPAWMLNFLTARLKERDLRFTLRPRRGGGLLALVGQVDRIITRTAAMIGGRPAAHSGLQLPGPEGPRPLCAPAVIHIRLPLFLFFLSEAILRPILPQFLGQFALPDTDQNFQTGLIMAGFMAASLVSVLIGSIFVDRSNPRRVFLWGAFFTGAGMIGHLVAGDFSAILLMRMLTGFGYGLVYAAAQVYIAQHADPQNRNSGFSLFLAVIVAAEITGPAIGGILADQLGMPSVLAVAALAAGVSALTCLFMLSSQTPDLTDPAATPASPPPPPGIPRTTGWLTEQWIIFREILKNPRFVMSITRMALTEQWVVFREILKNPRFVVVIVCFAIPAKALLTGGLFLLVPLTAVAAGASAAESARVLMGYGIAILLLVPLTAPLADRWRGFGAWAATGSMIAGAGFVLPHSWNVLNGYGLTALLAATLLFGVGQTLSITTQISFVMQMSARQVARSGAGAVLGLFRFLERLGSFLGPLIAGSLLLVFPPDLALMWMGLGASLLAACGMSWFLAFGEQDEEEATNALLVET